MAWSVGRDDIRSGLLTTQSCSDFGYFMTVSIVQWPSRSRAQSWTDVGTGKIRVYTGFFDRAGRRSGRSSSYIEATSQPRSQAGNRDKGWYHPPHRVVALLRRHGSAYDRRGRDCLALYCARLGRCLLVSVRMAQVSDGSMSEPAHTTPVHRQSGATHPLRQRCDRSPCQSHVQERS